jgi:hypothetical protein
MNSTKRGKRPEKGEKGSSSTSSPILLVPVQCINRASVKIDIVRSCREPPAGSGLTMARDEHKEEPNIMTKSKR